MNQEKISQLLEQDSRFVWHPYESSPPSTPIFAVKSASGVLLKLKNGKQLIDGMSSWWCAIHGYNVPALNKAIKQQLSKMAHVMFGGLTHRPAIKLCKKLVEITPVSLQKVFLADSGSVAVEVALKMAVQYWQAKRLPLKQHFVSLRGGYHGDTLGAMSVCDPVTGMHSLFNQILPKNYFVKSPSCGFNKPCLKQDIEDLATLLETKNHLIAALIVEPIVQGAGGMKFYSADYLKQAHNLCQQYNVLLIVDEIATGFGRTGKLFASEFAKISPDIMCVGKSLTGGYLSLAATLCSKEISQTISCMPPFSFMHGPTFMANPLACAVALENIDLLEKSSWQVNIHNIENLLQVGLEPCRLLSDVADIRVLGAIGVVEMKTAVNMSSIVQAFVDEGVWIRPFGKLIYLMPAYIIKEHQLNSLCTAVFNVLSHGKHK